jgi:hypothetical protein
LDSPTIPLVDLLLEKLQIVEINRKDLVDIMVLLAQYPLTDDGHSTSGIDSNRIVNLCAKSWGWWRTTTMNIKKTSEYTGEYLGGADAQIVKERLNKLSDLIEKKPKSAGWKLRSKIGDRIKWYDEVEEVERD